MNDGTSFTWLDYAALGIDAIPLKPGTKRALLRRWPRRDPAEQWRCAPPDANIGVRGGGEARLAVLECDDHKSPATSRNAADLLFGLGCEPGSYPVTVSASGGSRHFWVTFTGGLPGHFRTLTADFGAGEFRYGPGSLTVAPPSRIGEGVYQLPSGDLRQLPCLMLADVLPILHNQALAAPGIPEPDVPRTAWQLLRGQGVDAFPSRSEAEEALITRLINAGFDFDSVLRLFLCNPAAGKFAELHRTNPADAVRWLYMSYQRACEFTANHSPARLLAFRAREWATARAWPGRTGSSNRAVYLAHCALAWRAGTMDYGASVRELAEGAGVTRKTAAKATRRLLAWKLLQEAAAATICLSQRYRLSPPEPDSEKSMITPLPHIPTVREWGNLHSRDLFRVRGRRGKRGLGKAAAEVFEALQQGPRTVGELAEKTGRALCTVRRALARMSRIADPATGELLAMVKRQDGDGGRRWYAQPVDLDLLAQLVGTDGTGSRQRARHAAERADHRRTLAQRGGGG